MLKKIKVVWILLALTLNYMGQAFSQNGLNQQNASEIIDWGISDISYSLIDDNTVVLRCSLNEGSFFSTEKVKRQDFLIIKMGNECFVEIPKPDLDSEFYTCVMKIKKTFVKEKSYIRTFSYHEITEDFDPTRVDFSQAVCFNSIKEDKIPLPISFKILKEKKTYVVNEPVEAEIVVKNLDEVSNPKLYAIFVFPNLEPDEWPIIPIESIVKEKKGEILRIGFNIFKEVSLCGCAFFLVPNGENPKLYFKECLSPYSIGISNLVYSKASGAGNK